MALAIVSRVLPALVLAAITFPALAAEREIFISCPGSSGWPAALTAAAGRSEILRQGTSEAALPEAFLAAWVGEALGISRGRLPGSDPIARSAWRLLDDWMRGRCFTTIQAVEVREVQP
jgi:hypothetical protein